MHPATILTLIPAALIIYWMILVLIYLGRCVRALRTVAEQEKKTQQEVREIRAALNDLTDAITEGGEA